MKAHKGVLSLVLALCFAAIPTRAQELAVAAAADLKFAMSEVAGQYEKQTGNKVNVTYGSSGNFFSQLQNGAPFDLFFSADIDYARKLETAGLAEPGTLYRYAIGRIVIWAPADSKVDVATLGWKALLSGSVQKIAIANPEHAPYGRAAVAAMQKPNWSTAIIFPRQRSSCSPATRRWESWPFPWQYHQRCRVADAGTFRRTCIRR